MELLAFNWELHAWIIPLTFATGWVIGQQIYKDGLRRRHPDLMEELDRRTKSPNEESERVLMRLLADPGRGDDRRARSVVRHGVLDRPRAQRPRPAASAAHTVGGIARSQHDAGGRGGRRSA